MAVCDGCRQRKGQRATPHERDLEKKALIERDGWGEDGEGKKDGGGVTAASRHRALTLKLHRTNTLPLLSLLTIADPTAACWKILIKHN